MVIGLRSFEKNNCLVFNIILIRLLGIKFPQDYKSLLQSNYSNCFVSYILANLKNIKNILIIFICKRIIFF
jgi:hypothetical protein